MEANVRTVIGKCPICGEELAVTRLDCGNCGTEIGGRFGLGRLYRLDTDDINFVETFIKNRGNAYKVGEELELPYSQVRARLTEIIRALGYEPGAEPREESGISAEKRKAILDDLAAGKLTSDAAVKLLQGE
jgi:hypothetical protein